VAPSSSGLGRSPLKADIGGSNPPGATTFSASNEKCALRAPGEADIGGSNPPGATTFSAPTKNAPCARPARLISAVRIRPGLPLLGRNARPAPHVRIVAVGAAPLSPNVRNLTERSERHESTRSSRDGGSGVRGKSRRCRVGCRHQDHLLPPPATEHPV
jgi:hypothetical protein